ncbi:hypothetical protein DYB34_014296 [Aphanomyces astaci]|uniref:Uncharacterized protein n=1 Tax=Aphanomyces astaci TaxID=112090 RepID=A0A3R7DS30_APHAT|nr:hypothetical protein DYB34_014296 [Aphanomyces astaci]
MTDDQRKKAKEVVDLTGDDSDSDEYFFAGAQRLRTGSEDPLLDLFMKKEEQRIHAEHQAAADLVQTALRTVGPMAVRELLRNEIVALEERHRKEDMRLQREMEQAAEESMAESIAEAEAQAAQAAEDQAGTAGAGATPAVVQVQEPPVGQAALGVQAAPNIKIKDEGVGQMAVENGPLGMREVRLEDVRTLKLHEQDDSALGVCVDYINGRTRRLRVLQQLDSRLQDWGWTPALREPVERYLTLFCRSGLFETQVMWLVCALEHMTILEIPLAEFVDWKDKMRERISDWSYDAPRVVRYQDETMFEYIIVFVLVLLKRERGGKRRLGQLPHNVGLLANGRTNFALVRAASGRVPAEIVSRLAVRVRMRRALEVRTLLSLRLISML